MNIAHHNTVEFKTLHPTVVSCYSGLHLSCQKAAVCPWAILNFQFNSACQTLRRKLKRKEVSKKGLAGLGLDEERLLYVLVRAYEEDILVVQ